MYLHYKKFATLYYKIVFPRVIFLS